MTYFSLCVIRLTRALGAFASLLRLPVTFILLVATCYSLFAQTAVTAAPPAGSLIPKLESIAYEKDDNYRAFFSYQNDTGRVVITPIGKKNSFTPDIENRGQPTTFVTGTQTSVFSVVLRCATTISWTLAGPDGKTNIAVANAPLCANQIATSSCVNPIGWFEDKSKRSETTATYYVAREPNTAADVTPQTSPSAFKTILCSFSEKKYYKNSDTGAFEGILNQVVARQNGRFAYQSTGNDYIASFAADPNNGFEFKNAKGVSFGVKTVSVDEKPLMWDATRKPVLSKNTITYENILPDTDLRYILDNEGISKFFVLKSSAALITDFAKIEFILSDTTKPVTKTNLVTTDLEQKITTEATSKGKSRLNSQSLDAELKKLTDDIVSQKTKKVGDKSKTKPGESIAALDVQINSFDDQLKKSVQSTVALVATTDLSLSKSVETQIDTQISAKIAEIGSEAQLKTLQTKDPNTLTDTERRQTREYSDLSIKKSVAKEKTEALAKLKTKSSELSDYRLKTETERIQNLGAQFDTLKLDDSLQILPPSTGDANPTTFNNESTAITNNGKTLTIYPNQEFLRSGERQFPIMIDPSVRYGVLSKDTFVTTGSPASKKGTNNRQQIGVGSNLDIFAPSGGGFDGHAYSLLQFYIPTDFANANTVSSASLGVRQYGRNGPQFNISIQRMCFDFDEWNITWNDYINAKNAAGCEGKGVVGQIYTSTNNSGTPVNVWSSDIANAVKANLDEGSRDLRLVLHDEIWDGGNRGVALCSKDPGLGGDPNGTHVCNSSGGSFLEIYLKDNYAPSPPGLAAPANISDRVGGCNISDGNGNCARTQSTHYTITNINDGDGGSFCGNTTSDLNNAGWYLRTHNWFQTKDSGQPNGKGNDFINQDGPNFGECTADRDYIMANGVYLSTAANVDRTYDSGWSNFNTFAIDNSAPLASTFPKQREFTKDQISLAAPTFGDNTYERYAFVYENILKNVNQLTPTIAPTTQLGFDSAAATGTLKTTDTALTQVFPDFVGGKQSLRWNSDRNLCVTLAAVGAPVTLATCDGRESQWFTTTTTGQIKLKNSAVCLEVENASFTTGTRVIAATCNTNPNQNWKFKQKNSVFNGQVSSGLQLMNFGGTATNANPIQMAQFDGELRGPDPANTESYGKIGQAGTGNTYFWRDGLYSVESNGVIRTIDGACIDIGAGNRLTTFDCHGGLNQQWTLTPEGELKSGVSGQCADITGGDAIWSGFIYAAPCNGGLNQKFKPIKVAKSEVFAQKYGLNILSQVFQGGVNPANQYPNMGLLYNYQVRKVGQAGWTDTCWGQSVQLQLPGYTCVINNATVGSGTFALAHGDQVEVRVRTKDRTAGLANVSAWQSMGITTVDKTKPVVSNLTIRPTNSADYQGKKDAGGNPIENDQRISPNNAQNRKKTITVNYTFADNAPLAARLKILDKNQAVVGYFDTCTYNGATKPCNTYAHNFASGTANTVSFAWDGKDAAGNVLADGKYDIQPLVYDKTCDLQNLPQTQNTDCNLSDATAGDTFVVVDNTGANIGISEVANNGWTNKNPFLLSGGLAGYNQPNKEDRDAYDVKICQSTPSNICGTAITDNTGFSQLIFNDIGNFSYPSTLTPGPNIFKIRSNDLAWNLNDKIGDPTLAQTSQWTVNYEQNAPQILSTTITGTNLSPSVKFVLTDPNTTGNAAAVSGLNLGVSPTGYDLTLLRQQTTGSAIQEIPLYRDGINLVDPNSPQRLLSAFSCATSTTNTAWTECTAQLNQLQLDGTYTLLLRLRDKAGNQTCAKNQATSIDCGASDRNENQAFVFAVKTRVAHVAASPAGQTVRTARPQQTFSGQTERGASVAIRGVYQNRELRFVVDSAQNNTIPSEYDDANAVQSTRFMSFATEAVSIICAGQRIDDDSNPGTEPVEVCTWSIKAKQDVNSSESWGLWRVTARDTFGNQKSNDYTIITSTGSIKASSTPDINSFSPNADGKLDTVTFANLATDADGTALTDIVSTGIYMYNSADAYVWGSWNAGLKPSITWDGKNTSGVVVPDGKYRYSYVITRNIAGTNTDFVVGNQYIWSLTNVGQNVAPTISTPKDGSNTSRGVFSIQGQAQSSTDQSVWSMNLCTHLITTQSGTDTWGTLADAQACIAPNILLRANTTSTGYYGALMALPQSQAGAYRIAGYSTSSLGFVSPLATTVTVTLDPTDAIMSAALIPNLDGINSQDDLAAYTAGTKSLNDLKTLEIKTVVSRNTELLDLDFVTYDNVGKPVTNVASQTFKDGNRIATISAVKDTNTTLRNKQNEDRIKRDLAQLYPGTPTFDARPAGALMQQTTATLVNYTVTDTQNPNTANTAYKLSDARATKCTSDQCEWTIQYPYPYWISGGTFEVRFRAHKGGAVSETTRSFQINGQITSDPLMLRTDKYNLTPACITALSTASPCDRTQNTSYANAVPARTRNDAPNTTTFTNSSKNTLWFGADAYNTMLVTLNNGTTTYPSVPLAANINGVAKMDINLRSAPYNLTSDAALTVSIARASSPATIVAQYNLVYDITAPTLASVVTSNNSANSTQSVINPWIKPGDSVRYSATASEPLFSGTVLNEVGFKGYGKKNISTLCNQFSNQAYQDNLATGADFTNCRTQYLSSSSFVSDLSVVGATESLEGTYAASIALEDIAGNLSLTTNRIAAQALLQSSLDATDPLRSNLTTKNIIDTKFLVDGTSVLTASQLLIKNGVSGTTDAIPAGYPYAPTSRARSLDFTLLVDGTAPYRQNLVLTGWGNSQKVRDTLCTDAAGILLASDTAAITKPCSVLAEKIGQNINAVGVATNPLTTADSLNADGIFPETIRTTSDTRYVLRSPTIDLKGRVEKNQQIVLIVSPSGTGSEQYLYPPLSSFTNCTPQGGTYPSIDKVSVSTRDNITTRFKDVCDFSYRYTFPDIGSQGANGSLPNFGYTFSYYTRDLAGNVPDTRDVLNGGTGTGTNLSPNPDPATTSTTNSSNNPTVRSLPVLVYHDASAPELTSISLSTTDITKQYVFGSNTPATWDNYDITNDSIVTISNLANELSLQSQNQLTREKNKVVGGIPGLDAIQWLSTEKDTIIREDDNTPRPKQTDRMQYGGQSGDELGVISTTPLPQGYESRTKYILSANQPNLSGSTTAQAIVRDEDRPVGDGCVQTTGSTQSATNPIPNRRMGVCNDGVYRVKARSVDTAGNREWWKEKAIERDTVSPNTPQLTVTNTGLAASYTNYLGVNVVGEALTNAVFTITMGSNLWTQETTLDQNGTYATADLFGQLVCGNINYTITVKLKDRAGNISNISSGNLTTNACKPVVSTNVNLPVNDPNYGTYVPNAEVYFQEQAAKAARDYNNTIEDYKKYIDLVTVCYSRVIDFATKNVIEENVSTSDLQRLLVKICSFDVFSIAGIATAPRNKIILEKVQKLQRDTDRRLSVLLGTIIARYAQKALLPLVMTSYTILKVTNELIGGGVGVACTVITSGFGAAGCIAGSMGVPNVLNAVTGFDQNAGELLLADQGVDVESINKMADSVGLAFIIVPGLNGKKFVKTAEGMVEVAAGQSAKAVHWLKIGAKTDRVYLGFDRSLPISQRTWANAKYVGKTNNIGVRESQHNAAGKDIVLKDISEVFGGTYRNLTPHEARTVEQYLINKRGLPDLDNAINSIAPAREFYDEVLVTVEQFMRSAGVNLP